MEEKIVLSKDDDTTSRHTAQDDTTSGHAAYTDDKSSRHTAQDDATSRRSAHTDDTPLPQLQKAAVPPPPNGGYGWVIMMAAFFLNADTWGVNSTYGVFLAYYLANSTFPGATSLDYAFVGSLSVGCAMAVSPLATSCVGWFGTKLTLVIGVVFEVAALLGASFAHETWQLYLSQGVCFGFGTGFLFVASVGLVPQWFTTRRSLANGIAAAGSGLGGLVYSLAAGAMIPSIGLAWTFRVLAIIVTVCHAICILLIRDRNKIIGSKQMAFDYMLFARPEYLLLCFYGAFSLLGYVVIIFSVANYAEAIGLSASQASIVSALLNLGQALGRPPIGYFSDTIGRINMAALMSFLCGLFALVIWTDAHSYGVLIFYALIGGSVAGTFWATVGPVSVEVVGLKHVPGALSLIWLFICLPSTFSEPIGLEIVDRTGQYIGAQLFAGFMYMAAALSLLVLRGWKIKELEVLASLKSPDDSTEMDELYARKVARKGMLLRCCKWAKV